MSHTDPLIAELARRMTDHVGDLDAPAGGLGDVRRRVRRRRHHRFATIAATVVIGLGAVAGTVARVEGNTPVDTGPATTPAVLPANGRIHVAPPDADTWQILRWTPDGYDSTVRAGGPDIGVSIRRTDTLAGPPTANPPVPLDDVYSTTTGPNGRLQAVWEPEPGWTAVAEGPPFAKTGDPLDPILAVAGSFSAANDGVLTAKLRSLVAPDAVLVAGDHRQWLDQISAHDDPDRFDAVNMSLWANAGWDHMWLASAPAFESYGMIPTGRTETIGDRTVTIGEPGSDGRTRVLWSVDDGQGFLLTYDSYVTDDEALATIAALRPATGTEIDGLLFPDWRPDRANPARTATTSTTAGAGTPDSTTRPTPEPSGAALPTLYLPPDGIGWAVTEWGAGAYELALTLADGTPGQLRVNLTGAARLDGYETIDGPNGPVFYQYDKPGTGVALWHPDEGSTALLIMPIAGRGNDEVRPIAELATQFRAVDPSLYADQLRQRVTTRDVYVSGPADELGQIVFDPAGTSSITTRIPVATTDDGYIVLFTRAGPGGPNANPVSARKRLGGVDVEFTFSDGPGPNVARWLDSGHVLSMTFRPPVTLDSAEAAVGALRHPTQAELDALLFRLAPPV